MRQCLAVWLVDYTVELPCVTNDFCLHYPVLFQLRSTSFVFLVSWLHSFHVCAFPCGGLVCALLAMIQSLILVKYNRRINCSTIASACYNSLDIFLQLLKNYFVFKNTLDSRAVLLKVT